MKWRLLFLVALLLPELPLNPDRGDLPCSMRHWLGTDSLGRDALLRLLHAGARSLGFASAVALLSLVLAVSMAMGKGRASGMKSAARALPPLLLLIPLAACVDGLGWLGLAWVLAMLMALQLEPPLRARLDPVRLGPAWAMNRVMGGRSLHHWRVWMPWVLVEAAPLFPTAWISALWAEATLRLLGLGPSPQHDSMGLLLNEELPRLSTDSTPLGWTALLAVLLLAVSTASPRSVHAK